MTQKELKKEVFKHNSGACYCGSILVCTNKVMKLFQFHIREVLKDEEPYRMFAYKAPTPRQTMVVRNQFRKDLRKAFGLEDTE